MACPLCPFTSLVIADNMMMFAIMAHSITAGQWRQLQAGGPQTAWLGWDGAMEQDAGRQLFIV